MTEFKSTKIGLLVALGVFGCGDGDGTRGGLPWEHDGTQVIGPERGVTVVDRPTGDSCFVWGVEFSDANCVKPQERCDGAFDVLVGDDKVLETLCYPKGKTLSPVEVEAKDGVIAQNENNAVIVLPDDASSALEADLAVDANNVVIYGHGPDGSVLDGDLLIEGNNAIVRGVRITGDVTISKNNATFFFCVIEGDVTINANNTTLAGCDILGSVTVLGNNTRLVGNHLASGLAATGKNTSCESNFLASDANENLRFETGEIGAALGCK